MKKLLFLLLIPATLQAQVYECAGTWTTTPCPVEQMSAWIPETTRVISQEEQDRYEIAMIQRGIDADFQGKYGFNSYPYQRACRIADMVNTCRIIAENARKDFREHEKEYLAKQAELKKVKDIAETKDRLKRTQDELARTQDMIRNLEVRVEMEDRARIYVIK